MSEPCAGTSADSDGRCDQCGSKYHCPKCGMSCGMYGHSVPDNETTTYFYKCQEPERYKALQDKERLRIELAERAEYERLKKKYG